VGRALPLDTEVVTFIEQHSKPYRNPETGEWYLADTFGWKTNSLPGYTCGGHWLAS